MRRGAGEPDGVCLYSSLSAAWHSTAVPRLCTEGLYSDQLPVQSMVGMAAAHLRRPLHSQPRCTGQDLQALVTWSDLVTSVS